MLVANGMEIPADGMLLQGADLLTDESAMTGETNPIKKEILSIVFEESLYGTE